MFSLHIFISQKTLIAQDSLALALLIGETETGSDPAKLHLWVLLLRLKCFNLEKF
jgi:hypothetical protein